MNVMYLTLLICLLYAVYTDMTRTIISNRLIIVGLIIGLVFRMIGEGKTGILISIINLSIPVILLYLLFCCHALGAGDIKLFSMAGVFLTTKQLLELLVLAFLTGAVLGLGKLAYQILFLKNFTGKLTQIHFSLAVLIAYLIGIWRWRNG